MSRNSFIVWVLSRAASVISPHQGVQFTFQTQSFLQIQYVCCLHSRVTEFTLCAAGCLEDPTPQRCRAGGGGYDRGPQSGRPGEMAAPSVYRSVSEWVTGSPRVCVCVCMCGKGLLSPFQNPLPAHHEAAQIRCLQGERPWWIQQLFLTNNSFVKLKCHISFVTKC